MSLLTSPLRAAGLLPHPEYTVATMSIFQITIGQCFYFSLGIGIAASTRVANLLGAGDPQAARLASRTGILTGLVVVLSLSAAVLAGRHQLPRVYTEDPVLGEMMAENFFVMAFCKPRHPKLDLV